LRESKDRKRESEEVGSTEKKVIQNLGEGQKGEKTSGKGLTQRGPTLTVKMIRGRRDEVFFRSSG